MDNENRDLKLVLSFVAAITIGCVFMYARSVSEQERIDTSTLAIVNDIDAINSAGGPAHAADKITDLSTRLAQAKADLKAYDDPTMDIISDGPGELRWEANRKILLALKELGPDVIQSTETTSEDARSQSAKFLEASGRLRGRLDAIRDDYRKRANMPIGNMTIVVKDGK